MEIRSICVIGGGCMGCQIALDTASHGSGTVMYDYYTKMIKEGRPGKAVGKGFYDYT